MSLSDRLRAAREGAGKTQKQVADLFGITTQAVSQWERHDDPTMPAKDRLLHLAEFYSVPFEWLASGRNINAEPGDRASAATEMPPGRGLVDTGFPHARPKPETLPDLPVYGAVAGGYDGELIDFSHPIGHTERPASLRGVEGVAALRGIFGHLPCEFVETSIRTAEMLKYACNVFHALKVTFANEIGRI